MANCCKCGCVFDEEKSARYRAFDLQIEYEELTFCSKDCLKDWVAGKIIGMWTAFLIGVVIAGVFLFGGNPALALPVLFLPYTIRQLCHGLTGAGEFLSFALVLLSTITVVYPAYKFVQELAQYSRIKKEYGI